MKTILRNIVIASVVLGSYTTYANEKLELSPTTISVEKGDKITVSDKSRAVIYSGQINFDGNLTSLFDFTQLNDGNYTIEVNKDFVIEVSSIEVKNNVVTFNTNAEKQIFKPVFRLENSKIIISKLALDNKHMNVKIYYNDDAIFSETVKGKKVLNRIYQLDNSYRGEYTAVITSNNRVFVETFRI
jgi:hypothetical protein